VRRFRLPPASIDALYELITQPEYKEKYFKGFGEPDAAGRPGADVKLLLLSFLRYVGRNVTYDCLSEATFISEATHKRFFTAFVEFGADVLYKTHMLDRQPKTAADIEKLLELTRSPGFPGMIGSADCMHTYLLNCSAYQYNYCKNGKYDYASVTFQVTVTPDLRFLSVTRYFPGTTSDQAIRHYDTFLSKVANDPLYTEHVWKRYEQSADGVIVVDEKGVYMLGDKGLTGSFTMLIPFSVSSMAADAKWTNMHESLRKAVERAFGILQKRFPVLKINRMHFNMQHDVFTKLLWTLVALHNWLHRINGMDQGWEESWSSEVLKALDEDLPNPAYNDDVVLQDGPTYGEAVDDHTHNERRSKLVNHFWIASQRNEVAWMQQQI